MGTQRVPRAIVIAIGALSSYAVAVHVGWGVNCNG